MEKNCTAALVFKGLYQELHPGDLDDLGLLDYMMRFGIAELMRFKWDLGFELML